LLVVPEFYNDILSTLPFQPLLTRIDSSVLESESIQQHQVPPAPKTWSLKISAYLYKYFRIPNDNIIVSNVRHEIQNKLQEVYAIISNPTSSSKLWQHYLFLTFWGPPPN
jgi:hypothetical protein